jgi:hypothetical protein
MHQETGVNRDKAGSDAGQSTRWRVEPTRLLIYTLSFVGIMAVLYAVADILSVLITLLLPHVSALISDHYARMHVSYDLAALLVGAPLWVCFWLAAQRRVSRSSAERRALERRLFLAAVFGVTAIVPFIALQDIVRVAITLSSTRSAEPLVRDGITATLQILTYGAAWLRYGPMAWRESEPGEQESLHGLAA